MFVELAHLWPDFLAAKSANEPAVLAMIVRTGGSTYKKAGAMMLIDATGKPHGLLSGGCLEDDIAAHARRCAKRNQAELIHYDLSDDSPFGLGLGCRGEVDVLMLPMNETFEPLSTLYKADEADEPATLVIDINGDSDSGLGSFAARGNDAVSTGGAGNGDWLNTTQGSEAIWADEDKSRGRIHLRFQPRPVILVAGAGADAMPVHRAAAELEWRVVGCDHRPGLLTAERFPQATRLVAGAPSKLLEEVDCERLDAAILMSHNIDHDATYLKTLSAAPPTYVGILGPKSRRDEALEKAGLALDHFGERLHGPAGLDIGGRQPESIALSIIAEIHQTLHQHGRLR